MFVSYWLHQRPCRRGYSKSPLRNQKRENTFNQNITSGEQIERATADSRHQFTFNSDYPVN